MYLIKYKILPWPSYTSILIQRLLKTEIFAHFIIKLKSICLLKNNNIKHLGDDVVI